MLVLSRRQNERVNFPTLGITIEVLRTGFKKVQLGIEAPSDVRIVRDELAWNEQRNPAIHFDSVAAESIRQQLHSVAMAIRLSQNQIQQGLSEYAEVALDDAIELLNSLEQRISRDSSNQSDANECVREVTPTYVTSGSSSLCGIVDRWLSENFT